MKTLIGLLPIAAALGVAAAAIWLMVERNIAAGAWLLAALLIGHGLVHGLYLLPQEQPPADWPFDMSRSWLVTAAGPDAGTPPLRGGPPHPPSPPPGPAARAGPPEEAAPPAGSPAGRPPPC